MTAFADPGPTSNAGPPPPKWVMRGPEHADNYRIKVGRYKERFYLDPLPADDRWPAAPKNESYPSVSTIKGASGKDWSYTTLKRIANAPDLPAIAAGGFFERYEKMKVINALDLAQAQRRGTDVHSYAESLAYKLEPTRGGEGAAYYECVDKLFADLNPVIVAAEFVCIHRTLNGIGYGGTSDGIFDIDGKLWMVDWKSRGEDADHDCYPEEAGQIGGYCGAEYIIMADDDPANPHGAKRAEMAELEGGLIISIKPDSYEVYPIDIPKAIDHFAAQHAWWLARRTENKVAGNKWPPRRAAKAEPPVELATERRDALRARFDSLPADKQEQFVERCLNINVNDLDAVEALLDAIDSPPTVVDMAQARMAKDRERDAERAAAEADRRLATEGGPANPDDIKLFNLRWEMGMTKPGKEWLGRIVNEACQAECDFRLSVLNSQRRADLYCALTEWATVDEFDWNHDEPFRAVLSTAIDSKYAPVGELGLHVGQLSTAEAALMRAIVTQIAEGEMKYLVAPDAAPRWVPSHNNNKET